MWQVWFTSNLAYSTEFKDVCLIDTGATDRMCCSIFSMHDIVVLNTPIHVSLPNGSFLAVNQIASVQLTDKMILHYVLFVPHFHYNLFSVPKWTQDTCHLVSFFPKHCICQHRDQKTILVVGSVKLGLYHYIFLLHQIHKFLLLTYLLITLIILCLKGS